MKAPAQSKIRIDGQLINYTQLHENQPQEMPPLSPPEVAKLGLAIDCAWDVQQTSIHVKAILKCPLPGYLEMSGFTVGLAACCSSV
ncbi:hypothetical protein [Burkholderia ubonensis]|uniref:hypothetical protein n=1 Tax=Burkholderia ubonensis TaxID=101571 RepID=UPI0012F8496E|nr:hypothetical protein [Burkholderia ubonensis]